MPGPLPIRRCRQSFSSQVFFNSFCHICNHVPGASGAAGPRAFQRRLRARRGTLPYRWFVTSASFGHSMIKHCPHMSTSSSNMQPFWHRQAPPITLRFFFPCISEKALGGPRLGRCYWESSPRPPATRFENTSQAL